MTNRKKKETNNVCLYERCIYFNNKLEDGRCMDCSRSSKNDNYIERDDGYFMEIHKILHLKMKYDEQSIYNIDKRVERYHKLLPKQFDFDFNLHNFQPYVYTLKHASPDEYKEAHEILSLLLNDLTISNLIPATF